MCHRCSSQGGWPQLVWFRLCVALRLASFWFLQLQVKKKRNQEDICCTRGSEIQSGRCHSFFLCSLSSRGVWRERDGESPVFLSRDGLASLRSGDRVMLCSRREEGRSAFLF